CTRPEVTHFDYW
nr:immunoglobulin heavy chain junction region [Mus musculus]